MARARAAGRSYSHFLGAHVLPLDRCLHTAVWGRAEDDRPPGTAVAVRMFLRPVKGEFAMIPPG
jgi:hypothetical protein